MENNNNAGSIVVGLAIVGVIVAGIIGYNAGKQGGMQAMHVDMMSMENEKETSNTKTPMDHSAMTMDEMTEGLDGLRGDAFDKAFVEMMIVHHQGAVDMAELIPANARHEELKKLGKDIITAQTQEITMMKQWLIDWGYVTSGSQKMDMNMQGMDHSMMKH